MNIDKKTIERKIETIMKLAIDSEIHREIEKYIPAQTLTDEQRKQIKGMTLEIIKSKNIPE